MSRLIKIILITCIVAGTSALAAIRFADHHATKSTVVIDPIAIKEANTYNKRVIDSAVSLLRSGYIVLRTGLGADSYLLSQLNRKDKTYSHCGIVMVENGYPFIYHSIGGEDNPDECLRRDSAVFFFSPVHNSGLGIIKYDYTDSTVNKLKQIVYRYYKEKRKFDLQFDLKTDDRLYCAELVYKAVNRATGDSQYIKRTSMLGHTFVGTDDLFVNEHARFIWQIQYK